VDDAVWIEDERMTHAYSFRHPGGELPDGWFFCPRCQRIYPGSQWTKECPGRASRVAKDVNGENARDGANGERA